jgi:hypothetical protein
VRSYTGLLIFENLFDNIPTLSQDMVNFASSILKPNLPVVEHDCGTTLGTIEICNFESEGLIELATDLRLTKTRIEQILSQGIYEVAVRHTSTCISKGGVCAKCYAGTYHDQPIPKVLDRVTVLPEFRVNTEVVVSKINGLQYSTITDPESYDKAYVFRKGILLTPVVDYTLVNGTLTLTDAPIEENNIAIHCFVVCYYLPCSQKIGYN